MLVPSIITVLLITLFVLYTRNRRKLAYTEKGSWNITDSVTEEWPKRPETLPLKKNATGIYVDRIPKIEDTLLATEHNIDRFVRIGGENSNSLPLYTTDHSDEEHFLTTIRIAFHAEDSRPFLDILSLDTDFPLKDNNRFSLLFTNGQQWDFVFNQYHQEEYAASIPLSLPQLEYLAQHPLDKWKLRRDKDDYFTVGSLNFEVRKFVYKPELQATIQVMANKLLQVIQHR